MVPTGVGKGQPLVYSNESPGAISGCWPTTPTHLLYILPAIGNDPVAAYKLRRVRSLIGNAHGVGKHIALFLGVGLIGQVLGCDRHHEKIGFHVGL
jgi:hypothetical protein